MKKILVLTRNFPPLVGGMERLNLHMVEELSRRFDVRLVAPQGAAAFAPPGVTVSEVPGRPLPRFLASLTLAALRLARQWRPDIILAGSGLTALAAWMAARLAHARAIAYVHGLDVAVRHPVYRALWHPALRRLDGVIANSHATARLAESAGIPAGRIGVIHPGVRLPEPDVGARQRFRDAYGVGNAPVLLFVGRLSARKGLREFVADVLPRIVDRHPDAQLMVIGDVPSNALHAAGQSIESIQQVAGEGLARHLRFLGVISDEKKLAEAWAGADVHIFPVRHLPDDPEGFGMVAIEAAAHGLPTVAYATGGVIEAVGEGLSGYLVPPGDAQGFADAVCRALGQRLPEAGIRQFAAQFSWTEFGGKLGAFLET